MKKQPYQNFGEGGSSNSRKKLAELGLPENIDGTNILDIGCNAGFFCIEAIKRGAISAVGIEAQPTFYEAAIKNAKSAGVADKCRFILGDWNEIIPSLEERFDYILWLAAMHYEQRPARIANWLRWKIKPSGKLILDVGVDGSSDIQSDWFKLTRPGAPEAYPNIKMLHHIFSNFVLRYHTLSESLQHQGDRFIYHGSPRRPIVILIAGVKGAGKTVLANSLADKAVRISGDVLLSRIDSEQAASNEFGLSLEVFRKNTGSLLSNQIKLVTFLGSVNAGRGLKGLADLLCHPVTPDSDVYIIEGGILSSLKFRLAVKDSLGPGYLVWGTERV